MTDDTGFSEVTIDRAHNQPTTLLTGDDLTHHLELTYGEQIERADELLATEARLPAEVTDSQTDAKFTEFVAMIQSCNKVLEASRTGEKSKYDTEGGRAHAFFKKSVDALGALKKRVEAKQTDYKLAVAKRELEKREREAAIARAEEDRKRAEREKAEREAREAEHAASRKRNEAARAEAEAKATAARERANLAAAEEEKAAEERSKAEKHAAAPMAELSRERGAHGGVSSLRTDWTYRDLNRDGLDLEALRKHIPLDGLEKAVRSFINAGGRTLKGVVIFEAHNTTTRR